MRLNYYAMADIIYQDRQLAYLTEVDTIFAQMAAHSLKDLKTTRGLARTYYEATLVILE